MAKFISADEAVKMIKSGDTVDIGFYGNGPSGGGLPGDGEEIFGDRPAKGPHFDPRRQPKRWQVQLGLNRWGKEGLIKRVIAAHWGLQPDIIRLAVTEKIEAYNIPQGPYMNLLQAIASKKPGNLTDVGLKTFVDPRDARVSSMIPSLSMEMLPSSSAVGPAV